MNVTSGDTGSVEPTSTPGDVVNDPTKPRFEVRDGNALASLQYALRRGRLYLIHTEVPKALEGRGYASALARAALEYAKQEHLRVVPICPFVRGYLQRHPEYASLVARL